MPPPESVRIEPSRRGLLYEGTSFSLTCIITPNRTGVDTGFMVTVPTFSGPESPSVSDVTMRADMNFQTVLSFTSSNPLSLDNAGSYYCSSVVMSQLANIERSDATMNTNEVEINITRK